MADPSSEFKVKGLGYKEASHFLRNIGFSDVSILDRHVLRFLFETGVLPQIKTLTPRRYMEVEEVLGRISETLSLKRGELDLYIWYIRTGKVLK